MTDWKEEWKEEWREECQQGTVNWTFGTAWWSAALHGAVWMGLFGPNSTCCNMREKCIKRVGCWSGQRQHTKWYCLAWAAESLATACTYIQVSPKCSRRQTSLQQRSRARLITC